MNNIVSAARTSAGKKIITGLTGIGLILFIILHLAGNLSLFMGEHGLPFNEYAHFLENLGHGMLLPIAEIGLLLLFAFHIVAGIAVTLRNRQARPQNYYKIADAGHTSHKTASSQTMIVTGIILMCFLVLHILQFRLRNLFNGYPSPTVPGMKDLYRLVYETFREPVYVWIYCLVMVFLGVHLRHGFWSAFQSLGLNNPRWMPFFYAAGLAFAILIFAGFFVLPIYLHYFAVGVHAPSVVSTVIPGATP